MWFRIVGKKKFNDEREGVKLFLEDGFEIDEDELLLSTLSENKVLILDVNFMPEGKLTKGTIYRILMS